MHLHFLGAAGEVTGSCHLLEVNGRRLLLDCGLIQGTRAEEARNRLPLPFAPGEVDAVVLSHAHIDHSGRIPLLVIRGFRGPVYTHPATRDLCRIMLRDAGYLNEREAEWENRKRERKGLAPVEPLYDTREAQQALRRFRPLAYDEEREVLPGVRVRLRDAGHILGSAIVELWIEEGGRRRKVVFSGDLGQRRMPVVRDATRIADADLVLLESTYGDRQHRSPGETLAEIGEVLRAARAAGGNVLIPAFAVGRTQDVLYLFARHYDAWGLDGWSVFLDSPLAIEATEVYARHVELFDEDAARIWRERGPGAALPNLHLSRTPKQSMGLNRIRSGAIIIAGSGMCDGGRIRHHLKHNVWREDCHVLFVGFQARGTTGRALVDGARRIRLWGETVRVAARIHTVGGLSAHAGQDGLVAWYAGFRERPPVALVHGEPQAQEALAERLRAELRAPVRVPTLGERLDLTRLRDLDALPGVAAAGRPR
jgi:metallo-beta-lactamase family protein